MLAALAGGVGAARFLCGLVGVVDPATVTAIVNTGDDDEFHGLWVCPDLDSVTYALAGANNPETGWGLAGESFHTIDALDRYGAPTWFRLGDRDLATHLHRTRLLAEGVTLSEVTARLASDLGARHRVRPMSDQPVRTRLLGPDGWLTFQEYFVREKTQVEVREVEYTGAAAAAPAPGLLEAILEADAVIVCPSNPVTSIGPILAVPGIADTLEASRATVLAVSPIIGGAAVSGPAGRLMAMRGLEVSALGVAAAYAPWLDLLVIDQIDAGLAPRFEANGVRPIVADIVMRGLQEEVALAERGLAAALV